MIKFEILGEIKTKMRPRASVVKGHALIYTPKDTLYYENYVRQCYLNAIEKAEYVCGEKSFEDKPVDVSIHAYFKAPKKYEKYGDLVGQIACDKHKDLDNIAKTILDSLNKIAYDDDKQVVCLRAYKSWTNEQEKIIVYMSHPEGIVQFDEFKEGWKKYHKKGNKNDN